MPESIQKNHISLNHMPPDTNSRETSTRREEQKINHTVHFYHKPPHGWNLKSPSAQKTLWFSIVHEAQLLKKITFPTCSWNICAEGNMCSYSEVLSLISSMSKKTAPSIRSLLNWLLPSSLPVSSPHEAAINDNLHLRLNHVHQQLSLTVYHTNIFQPLNQLFP